ncbi:uncharacterized protein BHQ10_006427 [Talaromyces amestolkiae]|uniref:Uncharacterized protein n=1 Tax=Talaromyces amestolkiae TaxID=1196081 RepID=A0A364L3M2_TALAM|nr:uncharacterized protein BHQ10_006427 [Talaromyces amestolkiae]RAO70415.1 hypothetical protein BHQ10_006427 [Talaromyces amestolkiae]
MTHYIQDFVHELSLRDPEAFWSKQAENLYWHKMPSRALSQNMKEVANDASYQHWSWFQDGEFSTTYNCVDRHVKAGRGNDIAIIWESPVTKTTETYSYRQLLEQVELFAGVLPEEGVKKGDTVVIYSI